MKIGMSNPAWYDIEMRGRRLESISKRMNTEFWKAMNENNTQLAMGYHDALLRTEKHIQPYVEQMIGLNRFLKKHDKLQTQPIYTQTRDCIQPY